MSSKVTATTPVPKSGNIVSQVFTPVFFHSIIFIISTAIMAHIHQFYYIHTMLPRFLETYVEEEQVPLAILGLQVFFTQTVTGTSAVLARMYNSPYGYNNNNPRENDDKLTGLAARINSAHKNAHEALAPFVAALLTAYITKVPTDKINYFAIFHLVSRVAHFGCYILDLGFPRSLLYNLANHTGTYLFLFSVVKNFDVYFQTLCKLVLATPF